MRSGGQLDHLEPVLVGQPGDEVAQLATLGGYARKPFRGIDKETGETTMVTPIDMTLDAVE